MSRCDDDDDSDDDDDDDDDEEKKMTAGVEAGSTGANRFNKS